MISFARSLCALLALGCLTSCSPFPPNTGVLFTGADAQHLFERCLSPRRINITGVWDPTYWDIEAADRILWDAIHNDRDLGPQIRNLRRQYIGVIVNRRRGIYIKARGEPENEAWRTDPCGGGQPIFASVNVIGQPGIMIIHLGPGWD